MSRRVALLAALSAIACGVEPAVELGTGEIAFEPLSDGDTIEVIRGPQGGYHLVGSARMVGIPPGNRDDLSDPSNPTTTFEVWRGDEQLAPFASFTQGLTALRPKEEGFTHVMLGRFAILDIMDDDEVAGDTVRFTVTVTGRGGVSVSDTRTLDVVASPLNE